jgi:hypothetical protein
MLSGKTSRNIVNKDFVRVLNPVDPWLDPARQVERQLQFRGKPESSISVTMRSRCAEILVLASYHGPRKDIGLLNPSLFAFGSSEVRDLGGKMDDTDADPPWPTEYNHAHHDIVSRQQEVASAMSRLSQSDPTRVLQYSEIQVLVEIARLMLRGDVNKRFKKYSAYRFRRLFEDGGVWRSSWLEVAKIVPDILYDENLMKKFRSMWNADRSEWDRIARALPQIKIDNRFSSGIQGR